MVITADLIAVTDTARLRLAYDVGVFFEDRRPHPGQPTKLNKTMVERIYFLAKKGLIDSEIAYTLGVGETTLHKWKRSPTFSQTLQSAKSKINEDVARALLRRAVGFKTSERRIDRMVNEKGQSSIVKVSDVEREVVPDTRAAEFWLMNRCPKEWRRSGNDGSEQDKLTEAQELAQLTRQEFERLCGENADIVATALALSIGIPPEALTNGAVRD